MIYNYNLICLILLLHLSDITIPIRICNADYIIGIILSLNIYRKKLSVRTLDSRFTHMLP